MKGQQTETLCDRSLIKLQEHLDKRPAAVYSAVMRSDR